MKNSNELKQLRAAKIEAQQNLVKASEAEKRNLTEDETTQFRALQTEIDNLNGQIRDAVAYEENLRSISNEKPVEIEGRTTTTTAPKAKRSFSINAAIRSLIDPSKYPMGEAEKEAHELGARTAQGAGIGLTPNGFAVPMFDSRSVTTETRADGQTVTQDSAGYGGNTVATEIQSVIDYLRPRPVVESLGAVFLTGLQGNLQFPKNNGGITATWEGEEDKVDNTKNAYGKVEMKPIRLSVSVPISLQNLMQSSYDMEMYTMNEIRKAIEIEIDKAYFVGSGTGEPLGLINVSGTTTVALGTNGAAPTFAKVVEMETSIYTQNADANAMKYVSNSKVRGKLKTTPKESGQPIYLMENNEVNGYPYVNSNHVPSNLSKGSTTGTLSAAFFGDFSKSIIGQWGFMDLSVDTVSRKREGYVEVTANVFVDIAFLEPKAFAVCKDIVTA